MKKNSTNETLRDLMHTVHKHIEKNLELELKEKGITTNNQLNILLVLEGENLTQKEIARLVESDEPSIARTLDRMIKKGFVEKVNCFEDRRKNFISLTNMGYESVVYLKNAITKRDGEIKEILENDELVTFISVLQKINHNFLKSA